MERISEFPDKLFSFLYLRPKFGFFFWFLTGIVILFLFKPFQQPLMFDRAFLVYMSQVIARGESLYHSTPFGYTPLSTLVIGCWMRLGQWLSLDSIEAARVAGITFYGLASGGLYWVGRKLFQDHAAAFLVPFLFCGVAYLPIMASVNAEPKIWVLVCAIFGMYYFFQRQWVGSGLIFSVAAMSWHVAVISVVAAGITVLINNKDSRFKDFVKFSLGVMLATLPVFLYLWATDAWIPFWEQAIVRKLVVEGKSVGGNPFFWMLRGSYPLVGDALHLLLGFLGFVYLIYLRLFDQAHAKSPYQDRAAYLFLILYTALWSLFNSLEFQGMTDLIPLIPVIVIHGAAWLAGRKVFKQRLAMALGVLLLAYNWFDALIYNLPFTYQDQVKTVQEVQSKYGDPFVIGFEAYYTVLDQPMPTRFMRYWPYEDHLIAKEEGGCEAIAQWLQRSKYTHIVEFDRSRRVRSEAAQRVLDKLGLNWNSKRGRGKCADVLIRELTNRKEIDHFIIKTQSLPIGGSFYTDEYFSIFPIKKQ